MINDLDKTLETLLKQELPTALAGQVAISFAIPDDKFTTVVSPPAIDIFLYDVRENRDLRSNEWQVKRQSDGNATKKRSPVRVECSYLITAWPSDSAPNPIQDEHHILSEVMKVLLRYSTIPSAILQGELAGQDPPIPAITLQPGRLQSLGEFWQALGGKPKAALNYTVTVSVDVHKAVETGPPVVDKRIPG